MHLSRHLTASPRRKALAASHSRGFHLWLLQNFEVLDLPSSLSLCHPHKLSVISSCFWTKPSLPSADVVNGNPNNAKVRRESLFTFCVRQDDVPTDWGNWSYRPAATDVTSGSCCLGSNCKVMEKMDSVQSKEILSRFRLSHATRKGCKGFL